MQAVHLVSFESLVSAQPTFKAHSFKYSQYLYRATNLICRSCRFNNTNLLLTAHTLSIKLGYNYIKAANFIKFQTV